MRTGNLEVDQPCRTIDRNCEVESFRKGEVMLKYRLRLAHIGSVAAVLASSAVAIALPSGPANAHCTGWFATQDSNWNNGNERNINTNTCNGDKEYTGRYNDTANDGFRIYMEVDFGDKSALTNGLWEDRVWNYVDADTSGSGRICRRNIATGVDTCGAWFWDAVH